MQTETTTESVAAFTASQTVVVRWMQDEIDEAVRRHGAGAQVTVTRMRTPFGSFVKDVEPVW